MRARDLARLETDAGSVARPRGNACDPKREAALSGWRGLHESGACIEAARHARMHGLVDEMKRSAQVVYDEALGWATKNNDVRGYYRAMRIAMEFSLGIPEVALPAEKLRDWDVDAPLAPDSGSFGWGDKKGK